MLALYRLNIYVRAGLFSITLPPMSRNQFRCRQPISRHHSSQGALATCSAIALSAPIVQYSLLNIIEPCNPRRHATSPYVQKQLLHSKLNALGLCGRRYSAEWSATQEAMGKAKLGWLNRLKTRSAVADLVSRHHCVLQQGSIHVLMSGPQEYPCRIAETAERRKRKAAVLNQRSVLRSEIRHPQPRSADRWRQTPEWSDRCCCCRSRTRERP